MPVGANQADEFVALVDGQHVIFRSGKTTGMSNAIDQQSFDVGFHFKEDRVGIFDVFPGFERKQGFGGPGGAWIEGDHSRVGRTAKKERHTDGNHQALPLAVGEMKIGQAQDPPRHPLVFRPHAAEQNGAGVAGAQKLSGTGFNEVRMIGHDFGAAQFTPLHIALARPDEPAERSERVFVTRLN